MKNLVFLDIVGTGDRRYKVTLPPHIQSGSIVSLQLNTYSVEFEQKSDEEGTFLGPFYMQIKFSGGFETGAISSGAHPDMVPIPLLGFDGWAPNTGHLPLPIYKGKLVKDTFFIELYGMGPVPQPLDFTRALFWFVIETGDGFNTTTSLKL
jgi:hypothetical protein